MRQQSLLDGLQIETLLPGDTPALLLVQQSLLDGLQIETERVRHIGVVGKRQQSLLDGLQIETWTYQRLSEAVSGQQQSLLDGLQIETRSDYGLLCGRVCSKACSMACRSRPRGLTRTGSPLAASQQSLLDGLQIETRWSSVARDRLMFFAAKPARWLADRDCVGSFPIEAGDRMMEHARLKGDE